MEAKNKSKPKIEKQMSAFWKWGKFELDNLRSKSNSVDIRRFQLVYLFHEEHATGPTHRYLNREYFTNIIIDEKKTSIPLAGKYFLAGHFTQQIDRNILVYQSYIVKTIYIYHLLTYPDVLIRFLFPSAAAGPKPVTQ
jgi:hypothetical protein